MAAAQREIVEIRAKRLLKPGDLAIIPYATEAFAQEAEMSLLEYQEFITKACFLDKKDQIKEWKALSKCKKMLSNDLIKPKVCVLSAKTQTLE